MNYLVIFGDGSVNIIDTNDVAVYHPEELRYWGRGYMPFYVKERVASSEPIFISGENGELKEIIETHEIVRLLEI